MVAEVDAATALVVTVNVTLVAPTGTVTLAGTVAAELLLDSATCAPPAGAGPSSVTVPVELLPPVTVVGFTPKIGRGSCRGKSVDLGGRVGLPVVGGGVGGRGRRGHRARGDRERHARGSYRHRHAGRHRGRRTVTRQRDLRATRRGRPVQRHRAGGVAAARHRRRVHPERGEEDWLRVHGERGRKGHPTVGGGDGEIGRASCRERG